MTTAFLSGGPAKAVEAAGARDLWRALYPALAKGIKDRVANTVTSSLKVAPPPGPHHGMARGSLIEHCTPHRIPGTIHAVSLPFAFRHTWQQGIRNFSSSCCAVLILLLGKIYVIGSCLSLS